MNITLIHNPTAGTGEPTKSELLDELRAAGHEVSYASTKGGRWKKALQHPGDAVVVAGGDGTVGKVARRLVFGFVPMLVLPNGTANNFARSLGPLSDWREAVAALDGSVVHDVDVGVGVGLWGKRIFLEAASFGLVPEVIEEDEENGEEDDDPSGPGAAGEIHQAISLLRDRLKTAAPQPFSLEVDGRPVNGDALLLAIMNTPALGPRVRLAPGASVHSGMLDVVIGREQHRQEIDQYLEARLDGEDRELRLESHPARTVRVRWPQSTLHVDDKLVEAREAGVHSFFAVSPRALRVLLPT